MESLKIKATYLAKGIDLDKAVAKMSEPPIFRQPNRVLYKLGETQYALLYSFGVIVYLGATPEQEAEFKKTVHSAFNEPERKIWSDEYEVEVDSALPQDAVEFERVRVRELTPDRVDIICRIMAQSVAITQFDIQVDGIIKRFGSVYEGLGRSGRLRVSPRDLLRTIGTNDEILRSIIAELALLNVPQITWTDPSIERLWADLRGNFEMQDRFERLQFKLDYLRSSTEQLFDILQTRRSMRLELFLGLLFIIEVVVVIIEFLRGV
ncbi:hypothetical protein A3D72_04480 [Candidatus Uhrbacteria bacterium RIFCSPHIGHO2_02_FULL_57_19]|uniref:DUF155 domain-containing protein n=2 Tax=Parcubacteria group TaxID=1794811 RepID=A0A1F6CRT1_9BACT|nr:MAG: hypothetical protein A2704_04090 [Candidatus Kaiserbacteria bacterium RIFCSPHIGHO2_01_FULL_54_36b]OGL73215.1 MAG: hypothetical protein A3D72_04480 [Candidatus Uhrbacteria bacterium RIFCSPHIGHO2_02_FULL_57_19]